MYKAYWYIWFEVFWARYGCLEFANRKCTLSKNWLLSTPYSVYLQNGSEFQVWSMLFFIYNYINMYFVLIYTLF